MNALLACTTCYGHAEGPLIDAARLGIWLLLGVTVCLQAGFAAFFLYLRRRARRFQANHGNVVAFRPRHGAPAGGGMRA